ncbi:class IV adenylate cyclase [Candidatus Woesearchaeota archaeon]|nr:MAG: class IV adenylate cyclase [Candidatus Woesearchaeota archaeon]
MINNNKMIEVELRFKLREEIKDKLKQLGAKTISKSVENDTYFKFGEDKERRFIIRIRKKNGVETLTFKGSSLLNEDSAWQEWEAKISNSDNLKKLLLSNGFIELVKINKLREKFKLENFEINLDEVENLGKFVEVEVLGNDPEKARSLIMNFVQNKLGVPKDAIIQKGYVKLMLKE